MGKTLFNSGTNALRFKVEIKSTITSALDFFFNHKVNSESGNNGGIMLYAYCHANIYRVNL